MYLKELQTRAKSKARLENIIKDLHYPSDRIRFLRNAKGYTRKELAEEYGCHPDTIKNWEEGRTNLSAEALTIYSQIFDVSTDWILLGRLE